MYFPYLRPCNYLKWGILNPSILPFSLLSRSGFINAFNIFFYNREKIVLSAKKEVTVQKIVQRKDLQGDLRVIKYVWNVVNLDMRCSHAKMIIPLTISRSIIPFIEIFYHYINAYLWTLISMCVYISINW